MSTTLATGNGSPDSTSDLSYAEELAGISGGSLESAQRYLDWQRQRAQREAAERRYRKALAEYEQLCREVRLFPEWFGLHRPQTSGHRGRSRRPSCNTRTRASRRSSSPKSGDDPDGESEPPGGGHLLDLAPRGALDAALIGAWS